jgi:DNA polymerase-3 subunit beta
MSKFTVKTKPLLTELGFLVPVVKETRTNPNWQFILMDVEGTTLSMAATNGDVTATTRIELETAAPEKLSFVLPGEKLYEIVKLLETEDITLSLANTQYTLTSGKGRYRFAVNSLADAQIRGLAYAVPNGNEYVTVNAQAFITALGVGKIFAASKESTQFTLTNIGVDLTPEAIVIRSMDGHRAADFTIVDKVDGRTASLMVAARYVPIITLVATDETMTIGQDSHGQYFESGRRKVRAGSMIGKLPPISSQLEKYCTQPVEAVVDATKFLNAIRRLESAGEGKFRKLILSVADAKVHLASSDSLSMCAEFEEEVLAKTEGTAKCALNAQYLSDFLKQVEGSVTLRLNATVRDPVYLSHNSGLRYLVSQMG